MKKVLSLLMLLISLISITFVNTQRVNAEEVGLQVSSKSAYLLDYNSGTVLFSKNENQRLPIASMTKLMLLYLSFNSIQNDTLKLDEKIIVSENAKSMGGSQVFLEANGEYLCSELIKSVIVASANDASVALAERMYGSEEGCVEQMNITAKKLNMNNTLYSNCTGLTKPTQYSCAKDVAILLKEVCSFKEYFKYSNIWLDKIVHPSGQETTLTNTNKLVKFYSGCDGGKTGFTNEAGFCLSATAKRGNMRVIGVVINAENSKSRFNDVSNMFNYAFNNYMEKCVVEKNEVLNEKANVIGGQKNQIEVITKESFYIFSGKNKKINYNYKVDLKTLKAPIKKGEVVGIYKIFVEDKLVKEIELLSNESVIKKSYIDNVKDVIEKW